MNDIRSALAAAVDAQTDARNVEVKPVEPAASAQIDIVAPRAEQDIRRSGRKGGRRMQPGPQNDAAVATRAQAEGRDEARQRKSEPVDREAPRNWTRVDKDAFKALPESTQDFVLRQCRSIETELGKESEHLAAFHKEYEPVAKIFEPFAGKLKELKVTPQAAIQRYIDVEYRLAAGGGVGVIKALVDSYKFARSGYRGALSTLSDTRFKPEQLDRPLPVDPARHAATLHDFELQLEQFKSAEDKAGYPLHPHYSAVEPEMAALALAYSTRKQANPPLKELYQMAVWDEPRAAQVACRGPTSVNEASREPNPAFTRQSFGRSLRDEILTHIDGGWSFGPDSSLRNNCPRLCEVLRSNSRESSMVDGAASSDRIETPDDLGAGEAATFAYWEIQERIAEKEERPWTKRGREIVKRYRDERPQGGPRDQPFNILWSNVQTLQPTLYARTPRPDVERRFHDQDPTGRLAAILIERCLAYAVDACDFDAVMRAVVADRLLPGRGVARLVYVPHFRNQEPGNRSEEDIDEAATEREGGSTSHTRLAIPGDDEVVYEEVKAVYVFWEDYREGPARQWGEVPWVRFRAYLTREELIARFGPEKGRKVNLDHTPRGGSESSRDDPPPDAFKKAIVHEVWDKSAKRVIWYAPGTPDLILDQQDDPLRLPGFFPQPGSATGHHDKRQAHPGSGFCRIPGPGA